MIATPAGKVVLLGRRGWLPNFLLRSDFSTKLGGALVSPRTAEPGPGTLAITDTVNGLNISNGALQFPAVRTASGDPAIWGASIARSVGLAVVSKFTPATTVVTLGIGFDSNQTNTIRNGISLTSSGEIRVFVDGIQVGSTGTYTAAARRAAVVARTTGFLTFFYDGTNWLLLWVDNVSTDASLFPAATNVSSGTVGTISVDSLRALQLAAPFNDSYGLVTQRLAGARSLNDVFSHEANCLIEWIETAKPSAGQDRIRFRKQDTSNFWAIVIDSVGDVYLREIVATVSTDRGYSAAGVANGHRIVVVADSTTIRVYSNNVLRITYSSASNFSTQTSGEYYQAGTSSVVSEIISWPRTITGSPATELDNAANGTGTFLLNDEFTTVEGGPLPSPYTAVPGPGTLTITDTGNKASVSGGALVWASATGVYDPIFQSAAQTRVAGLTLVLKANVVAGRNRVGWRPSVGGSDMYGMEFDAAGRLTVITGVDVAWTAVFSTAYSVAQVLRSNNVGCFFLVKGGIYTQWTLLWVSDAGAAANPVAYLAAITTASSLSHDTARILSLPAPFDTDYGLATQRLAGAQSAGVTFVHEANCHIELTQTTRQSAGVQEFLFRMQDANNYWSFWSNETGKIRLYEYVAGVPTLRGEVDVILATGHRVVIVADGSTIRIYTNNVLRITYASASNFATATAGKLNSLGTGGAVSDIISWPRTLSGEAAAALDLAVA